MKASRLIMALGFAALAGCGRMAELKPAPGQSLPLKPAMARATPTAEQLLTAPTYAKPQRVDEIIKKSQPRKTDRFDLPPPSGGEAPTPPAQPTTSSDEAGPVTPQ